MEDLLRNDSSFDVYTNSEGGNMFSNRVLTTMPSEKSSFQVYLGFQGEEKTADATADKPKERKEYDPEKLAQGVTATAGAISSVGSTIQAFKGDGTKPKSRRKQLKEVCGGKPLGKKKQDSTGYTKCVADYNAGKIGNVETRTQTTSDDTPPPPPPPPTDNKKRNIIIGVVVVGLLVTAFVGYKKGWFGKKAN
jgi:hypothetical protein